jgi:hypothetical protein
VARLYANENFPRPVVEALRRLGHDVLTIQETGRAGAAIADRDVLAFAIAEGRAVLTINRRDFIKLHARTPAHAGIVACTLDLDFAGQAERIHAALASHADLTGVLIRSNRPA